MRELSVQEVGMVGGGNDSPPETMSVQCFVSLVAFGVSPFFGPGAVYGAAINAFTNCYGTDFTS
ncbi:hypothetical protein PS2015_2529 [Pseudohongiella spirulinae]|uniref:Uncharacterized protein n=1 Tax=Pseudohongiella spirulinae TaxID=1249552 RepID=A0A0S2KFS1_9GAMM|nr:hypothetical protein PS2015_2529 [Pseudohongiella spirulinae]